MQMGYDFDELGLPAVAVRDASPEPAPAGERLRHPEWAVLRARFLAGHALRGTLATVAPAAPAAGGFAEVSRSVLSDCRDGVGVNPLCSAKIKTPCAMIATVAASPTRGDRGHV